MRIAILGAGNVGGGLGRALSAVGHEIVFGVRDPESEKTRAACAATPAARAVSPAEAVEGSDVVIVALRWEGVPHVVDGLPSLQGRVVIDAMNRFTGDPRRSTTQDLADLLPGARLVKCFDTIGAENFPTARERETPVAMFVAGDDAEAKQVAMDLAAEIGFEPWDAGGLDNTKALEEMVKVWLTMARQHGRGIGFAISKR